jgi:hypothetical protein
MPFAGVPLPDGVGLGPVLSASVNFPWGWLRLGPDVYRLRRGLCPTRRRGIGPGWQVALRDRIFPVPSGGSKVVLLDNLGFCQYFGGQVICMDKQLDQMQFNLASS